MFLVSLRATESLRSRSYRELWSNVVSPCRRGDRSFRAARTSLPVSEKISPPRVYRWSVVPISERCANHRCISRLGRKMFTRSATLRRFLFTFTNSRAWSPSRCPGAAETLQVPDQRSKKSYCAKNSTERLSSARQGTRTHGHRAAVINHVVARAERVQKPIQNSRIPSEHLKYAANA